MELIVKNKPYLHEGRRIGVGDRIQISTQLGRVLVAVGLASPVPAEVAEPKPKKAPAKKPASKRTYSRRDMIADQGEE